MTRHMVVLSCSMVGVSLLAGCEGDPETVPRPLAVSENPVASAASSVASVRRPGPGTSEALAVSELDPFSLPSEYHAARGPLTPSTVTLPVDETYGGNAGFAFRVTQEGSGNGGWFRIRSPSSVNRMALLATHTGEGIAARAINTGMGRAFWAQIPEASNPFPALVATHVGSGEAIRALGFGSGEAIVARTAGTGRAGVFEIDNSSNNTPALSAISNGNNSSHAISGLSTGTGNAARFETTNTTTDNVNTVEVVGRGPLNSFALLVDNSGQGGAGLFRTASTSGASSLAVTHAGTGTVFLTRQFGTGDLASFQDGLNPRVRIEQDGDVFADGTFNPGGADLAESFDVEGSRLRYEPGDVLAISTDRARQVARSGEPYSSLVIGVYATKPGVLLSEGDSDPSAWSQIPVGVVGVLPTKVTAENGPIAIGDILVSSSRPGHAMKADVGRVREGRIPSGAILGKALEPFDGPGTGLIEVMVNVK